MKCSKVCSNSKAWSFWWFSQRRQASGGLTGKSSTPGKVNILHLSDTMKNVDSQNKGTQLHLMLWS